MEKLSLLAISLIIFSIEFLLWEITTAESTHASAAKCPLKDPDTTATMDKEICAVLDDIQTGTIKMQRQILALDQPVWKISKANFRWVDCIKYGPCSCLPESFNVNCWRLDLKEIPETQVMPSDVITLDLGHNKLQSLHKHTFKSFTQLVQLDISNNVLIYLPSTVFDDLATLKYLVLHHNRLDHLDGELFKRLTNLESLDLSLNRLKWISPTTWTTLHKLKYLYMSRNMLIEFKHFRSLKALEILDISQNEVKEVDNFGVFNKLAILLLDTNYLNPLPPNMFHGLGNLTKLNLENNDIDVLPLGIFKDLKMLTTLDLGVNYISQVAKEDFKGLVSLKNLVLSRNHITHVRNYTFSELKNLESLTLVNCDIEEIDGAAFAGLEELTSLDLANNRINELSRHFFSSFPKLEKLELNSNQLQKICSDCLESEILPELKVLSLHSNAWICDCEISYLANWIQDHKNIPGGGVESEDESEIDKIVCNGPARHKGKSLISIINTLRYDYSCDKSK